MCVIVVQKDKFPGWENLKKCWEFNPHGAGYMYQENDEVIISKGYTSFDDFKHSVERIPNYQSRPFVYHFRIATHGTVIPENTHPFPLSSKVKPMKALDVACPCAIAHNGIITKKMYDEVERARNNLSDTGQFIREITAMATNQGHIGKKKIEAALEIENKLSGSRFVMMDAKGVEMFGYFYEKDGCWYSNNHTFFTDRWRLNNA